MFDIESCLEIWGYITCYKCCIFWTSFKVLLHFCSWNPPFCWDQNNPGFFWIKSIPILLKPFEQLQTEDLIQIKIKIRLWFFFLLNNPFSRFDPNLIRLLLNNWLQMFRRQGCQVFTTKHAQLLLKTSPKIAQLRFEGVPLVKIALRGVKYVFFGGVPLVRVSFYGLNITLLGSL